MKSEPKGRGRNLKNEPKKYKPLHSTLVVSYLTMYMMYIP